MQTTMKAMYSTFNGLINTYCPEQAPVLQRAAGQE